MIIKGDHWIYYVTLKHNISEYILQSSCSQIHHLYCMNLRRQGNKWHRPHRRQKMSHLMVPTIVMAWEIPRDFHIFFICFFLSIFDKMTLTFRHWGSKSSANLIMSYYNIYSFYYTSIKPYFSTKQPINYVVITWSLYFKVVTFDFWSWPWNLTEKFAGTIIENYSSKQTFWYIAIHFSKSDHGST